MDSIKKIYHFPINERGEEIGEPIPVVLRADGSADISLLPSNLKKHLTDFGVRDELHRGSIFPADGERFLRALLREANGYRR
ncbi:hypothetical protein KKD42_03550, partial [Patescibacteria group bacterium]|nr:hypothetical protein [Patescibacteria group bacterium]